MDHTLTRDAKKALATIYKAYKSRRANGESKSSAVYFDTESHDAAAIASPSVNAHSCAFCISSMRCIMAASRSSVFCSVFVSISFTSLRCSVSSDTGICVYIHIIQPQIELVNTFLRKFCDFLC